MSSIKGKNIMMYIYITLVLLNLYIFLKQKAKITFINVYFLSSVIYYFNAFFGCVFELNLAVKGVDATELFTGTYVVLIFNVATILVFMVMRKDYKFVTPIHSKSECFIIKTLISVMLCLSLYMIYKYELLTRSSFDKLALRDDIGVWGTYFKYFAMFTFTYSYTQEKYGGVWKKISVIPILTTFLLGHRSFIVISLLAIFFDKIQKEIKTQSCYKYITRKKKMLIEIIIFTFFVLVIKGVTNALFVGNYDLIANRLTDLEFYRQVLLLSEPNVIIQNLNNIVSSDYQLSESSYWGVFAYMIPFFTASINDDLGFKNFTSVYQFDFDMMNMAASFIGEAYANAGYFGVVLIVLLTLILLHYIYYFYVKSSSSIVKCILLLGGIDISFYIHRNDLIIQVSRERYLLYIAIILILATKIVCAVRGNNLRYK